MRFIKTDIIARIYVKDFKCESITLKSTLVDGYIYEGDKFICLGIECEDGSVIKYPI
jgi:hypothetical protein